MFKCYWALIGLRMEIMWTVDLMTYNCSDEMHLMDSSMTSGKFLMSL